MTGGGDYSDQRHLLRSNSHKDEEDEDEDDVESQIISGNHNKNAFKDLFKHLDRGFSARHLSFKRLDRDRDRSSPTSLVHHHHHHHAYVVYASDVLGDSAPPEWALLLIGCSLGVASGLFVAAFNK